MPVQLSFAEIDRSFAWPECAPSDSADHEEPEVVPPQFQVPNQLVLPGFEEFFATEIAFADET